MLLGHGDGTFGPANTFAISGGSQAAALVAADFNGDGIVDLAATNDGAPPFDGTIVDILLGRGDGSFGSPVAFTVGTTPFPLIAADFNGDGRIDLAVGNFLSASVSVLLGQGDGTFASRDDFAVGAFPATMASADFNGDGELDLAVGGLPLALSILSGRGDGRFSAPDDFVSANTAYALAVGDFNLDGKPDVAMVYSAGDETLTIFSNTTLTDDVRPTITVTANPASLWPPNGRLVPVVISGTITDVGSGVDAKSAVFQITDEYGIVQPSGDVEMGADGAYSFRILLSASRRGSDKNGRHYKVTIEARDLVGNLGTAETMVVVPHDGSR